MPGLDREIDVGLVCPPGEEVAELGCRILRMEAVGALRAGDRVGMRKAIGRASGRGRAVAANSIRMIGKPVP